MTTTPDMDKAIASMKQLIEILGDPAKLAQYEAYLQAKRAQRQAKHAAKLEAWQNAMSLQCDAMVEQYRCEGAVVNKYFRDRTTGNIAVMLTKKTFDHAKSRMGTKLIMVYPDGSRTETMEKKISIKRSF